MTIDEIETISNQSNSTQISQDESFLNSTKKIKPINYAEINKKKEFLYSICTCGAQNPKFK